MRDASEERPVQAWIDRSALRHNARRALELADGRAVIAVVKADGYGHGAETIARGLLAEGIGRLAVVSVAEGAALRKDGIVAPILLMGGLDDPAAAERAHKWGLTPVLHDARGLSLAAGAARREAPWSVEVEVDTGMRRMGAAREGAAALLARVQKTSELQLSGVYTHLARADEPDPEPSREQIADLTRVLGEEAAMGRAGFGVHVANSAGLLRRAELEDALPGFASQAVRPGLMLYGVSPFAGESAESCGLEPVMTLSARVVAVRDVAAGQGVGYGHDWRASKPTRVATLPLGYADGVPRAAAGGGSVHLAGAMRPIVGRVSMDYLGLDVGDAPVAVGDLATVFGRAPDGTRVPVEELARAAGTIGYELLTGVGARVPRRLGDGPPAFEPEPAAAV